MVVAINRHKDNNYAVFNTGFISKANFNEVIVAGIPETLVKSALVATEGSFKDSNGTEHTFTNNRLNNIASATNTYLNTGGILPVCTDHQKNVANTVGNIGGEAYTKIIETKDLPNPKATHLLGKLGLFFSDVIIKSKDAIEKVRDGIVTSVSMGLNLDPDDHRVVELSLVPIAAIPNMGLFGYNPILASSFGLPKLSNYAYPNVNANKTDAFTWEDLESNEQSLDDLKEEFDGLTEDLWVLLNNIYNSSAIEITDISVLQQYVFTALNGFSQRVVDTLGLTNATDPSAASAGTDPSTQTAADVQQSNDIKYQDLASAGNTGVQYKYYRNNVASFKSQVKVNTLLNKYLG